MKAAPSRCRTSEPVQIWPPSKMNLPLRVCRGVLFNEFDEDHDSRTRPAIGFYFFLWPSRSRPDARCTWPDLPKDERGPLCMRQRVDALWRESNCSSSCAIGPVGDLLVLAVNPPQAGGLSLEGCGFEPYRQGLCVVCQTFQKAAFPVRDAKP
jgi:hypothetical protein